MSTTPPPPPQPSWQPPSPISVSTTGPPPGDGNRRTAIIAAAVAAAVVLIGGGVRLATRGDDDGRTVAATTTEDESTTTEDEPATTPAATTATTTAVAISFPTTLPPATTVVPATTTPPAPPEQGGVVDLGFGVTLPVPPGWEVTGDPDLPTISDGELAVTMLAVARPAGEDPAPLFQIYIETIDDRFEAVSYRPIDDFGTIDGGVVPVKQYGVTYNIFSPDSDDGIGPLGTVYLYQRADGLTVFYDIFARPDVQGQLPDENFAAFRDSLLNAPALAQPAAFIPPGVPRITTIHPRIDVSGTEAFTLAPGYEVDTLPTDGLTATNGSSDFFVVPFPSTGSMDLAVTAAQAVIDTIFPGSTFDAPVAIEGPREGIERVDIAWSNPTLGEGGVFGNYSVFFDARSGGARGAYSVWLGAPANPFYPTINFMFRSYVDSFVAL